MFENKKQRKKFPFVIYVDFIYEKFIPIKFCYKIVSYYEEIFKTQKHFSSSEVNVFDLFLKTIKKCVDELIKIEKKEMIELTENETKIFNETNICFICQEKIEENKVINYDELTGKFIGAVHESCNSEYKIPDFIPIICNNLRANIYLFNSKIKYYHLSNFSFDIIFLSAVKNYKRANKSHEEMDKYIQNSIEYISSCFERFREKSFLDPVWYRTLEDFSEDEEKVKKHFMEKNN